MVTTFATATSGLVSSGLDLELSFSQSLQGLGLSPQMAHLSLLTLPMLLQHAGRAESASSKKNRSSFGAAKNCIILFQSGGASQIDTYDPKPHAPAELRGDGVDGCPCSARRARRPA